MNTLSDVYVPREDLLEAADVLFIRQWELTGSIYNSGRGGSAHFPISSLIGSDVLQINIV